MGFYAHAIIARVEVRLNTSVAANLHGIVSETNTELDKAMATSVLFLKEQHKGIPVGTDGLIPLSHSRVAVPFEADLYVDISLVADGIPFRTSMCFSARKAGVSTKCFENLLVTVNWEALCYHSKKKDIRASTISPSTSHDEYVPLFVRMLGIDNDPLDRDQAVVALWILLG